VIADTRALGCVLSIFLAVTSTLLAATTGPSGSVEARAKELRELKFGLFVCWSFSTFSDKEWTRDVKDVSFFHPTGMDTDQWARVAQEAGMGYMLFLAKHHDGFCLWDTKTTDCKVTKSPLGQDVLAAVRKSCDKYGIKLALYFSEGDWTWPDSRNPGMKKAQLQELCTQYGPIEFFWMDHAASDGGLSHKETVAWVKKFQPRCFVGFNHGQAAGDLRLGEMGRPGSLKDQKAAGPYAPKGREETDRYKDYRVSEFALPILRGTQKPGRWFYTNPSNDNVCLPAHEIYRLYRGAVRYGNLFSLDVGPDQSGRLRAIDVRTLQQVGRMIRNQVPLTTQPE